MAFFDAKPKDPQAKEWGKRLYSTLIAAKRHVGRGTMQGVAWTQQFIMLKKEHGEEKVKRVLEWYLEHMNDEFVPQANSGTAFRFKFSQIAAAMERDSSVVEVDKWSKGLAEKLANQFSWPVEVLACLPQIISLTRKRCHEFFDKMNDYPFGEGSREVEFAAHLLADKACFFVNEWMRHLGIMLDGKEHYLGIPLRLAFHPESKGFKDSFWAQWSVEYCASFEAFDHVLEKLNEQKN